MGSTQSVTGDQGNKSTVNMGNMLHKKSNKSVNWKFVVVFLVLLLCASIAFAAWMIVKSYFDVQNLNERSQELYNLKNYNTAILNSNSFVANEVSTMKNLDEMIEYNIKLEWMTLSFEDYLHGIQASYDNFLKYILLPSLNLWKDPFLWEIDYNLIWKDFLEKNPYDDIELINKRSDFVKDVWNNNEHNDISSIELVQWYIEDGSEFYIPMTISYTAPSYRSLLLLLEKFSVTSNQKNISLINELVYHIWQVIKESELDEVLKVQEEYSDFSQDKAIWFILYNWVKWKRETSIINDQIIDKAIRNIAICWDDESREYCYYKFRDKYRSLPTLSYTIWLESSANKTEYLRDFFKDLTQIVKVVSFTYDWEEVSDLANYVKKQYKWTIEFRIYWDALRDDEVLEIQQLLWSMCLWLDLTPQSALDQINSKLTSIWKDTSIDTYTTARLMELESLITDIANNFDGLSNYKKVVRTFEMYRMLNEWNVCNL